MSVVEPIHCADVALSAGRVDKSDSPSMHSQEQIKLYNIRFYRLMSNA